MASLSPELRSILEKSVLLARAEAEKAAEVTLNTLAVNKGEAFATHSEEQRRLRNALRARGRQLGAGSLSSGLRLLVEEVAYEQWHRMLFARFLLENNLLIHPTGAAVTLQDCAELAPDEGESDPWQLAARYASAMLPGIFRIDDPSTQAVLPPEGRAALESILAELPAAIFTSDDGLGWVYQFWQTKRKKEVSSSERKITQLDLAAYSQLFTEDYMVRFLLENSLGAWWAERHPKSPLLKGFAYLRFNDDGTPAAGTFPGWPDKAAEITVMDPCCGSGHFLVAAFEMLRLMRMEEEGVAEATASDAVLLDNLFGLELDPRCLQISAFALALAAWRAGGYRPIPLPNVACSGTAVDGQLDEWTKMAGEDTNLRFTLEQLHYLFLNAPDLGSLINPADAPLSDRMFAPKHAQLAPLLDRALAKERLANDPVAAVFGASATGVVRAAELLARKYTLIATNVPYLARGKQGEILRGFLERWHPDAKADLATAFLERCREFVVPHGTYAVVTPQNWLFLASYKKIREKLLREQEWRHVDRLGDGAFETISGGVVNVALLILTNSWPSDASSLTGIDVKDVRPAQAKAEQLRRSPLLIVGQRIQLSNPDSIFSFAAIDSKHLLGSYASCYQGISPGDSSRLVLNFWEVPSISGRWRLFQIPPGTTSMVSGRQCILDWATLNRGFESAAVRGRDAWDKRGVAIGQMYHLPATLYEGALFSNSTPVIIPTESKYLPALWAFFSSEDFAREMREINPKLSIDNGYIGKVPFVLERWQKAADEAYPDGLPEPWSDDPTQWLFTGTVSGSEAPLQVAVARLLGYRWPQQDSDRLSGLADEDGILPLSAAAGEEPAAERLRKILTLSYGEEWTPEMQERLLSDVGFTGKALDVWLRDGFFDQHCSLFQQRPFIWQIWDGRRDGFSALVNYHKFNSAALDKLTYTYLGDWTRTQRAARDAGTAGADGRLVAALELQKKLELIRDGGPPYDIHVRWKPLKEQPIGWNPDLNDGIRMNIRPFVEAGVLRSKVNVNWKKDRGLNPDGSERVNDRHLTLAEKQSARLVIKS